MPQDHTSTLAYYYGEHYFIRRLGPAGARIIDGVTTPDVRRERCRQEIIAAGLADAVIGKKKDGTAETFAQCFARFYGVPLREDAASQ